MVEGYRGGLETLSTWLDVWFVWRSFRGGTRLGRLPRLGLGGGDDTKARQGLGFMGNLDGHLLGHTTEPATVL